MTALLGGEVDMMFNGLSSALPHIKTGKLRALAVGGDKRSPLMPDLATVAESGYQFNTSGWYGPLAPANTPKPVIARLHDTLIKALNLPQVKSRLTDIAVEVIGSTPQEYASRLREEMAVWRKVVEAAGLKGKQVN